MRQAGLWHPRLAHLVTGLGHGESIVVADPGLPVPGDVETVDLVYTRGEPGLLSVLRPILAELVVETATVAEELTDPRLAGELTGALGDIPVTRVSHERLKALTGGARAAVRTGEATPYANVILRAGVPF
ncbi:D-ribose pyranase [Plantactinospora sp. KBS50]|uniref:D-ribose pyranase n=1 Tax=Plantactinospora sp. KBS50 TaxID=2024580 RepID=UPI000BAACA08|nr:D-ribose pyranase [Plantactinospora sp. KBS50]ASW55526.1 D-ribose pyranase [Plantactinospora sp. KBS50]